MRTIYTLERYSDELGRWLPVALGGAVERATTIEEIQARSTYFRRHYPTWRLRAVEEVR